MVDRDWDAVRNPVAVFGFVAIRAEAVCGVPVDCRDAGIAERPATVGVGDPCRIPGGVTAAPGIFFVTWFTFAGRVESPPRENSFVGMWTDWP